METANNYTRQNKANAINNYKKCGWGVKWKEYLILHCVLLLEIDED